MIDRSFDIAVIGAGSAAEAFARAVGTERNIVVFEPRLVGGECPFIACMPSKSMLHDVQTDRTWDEAIARRDEIVSHLDDTDHAVAFRKAGATIVRERATIVDAGTVRAGDGLYSVDHIVVATGARPMFPEIDGLDPTHERVWTSRDALQTSDRPDSVVVIGSGVIGCELASVFAGFGSAVTTLDESERPMDDLHPAIGGIIAQILEDSGVRVVSGAEITSVEAGDDDVAVHLADGSTHRAERLLVATGRRPAVDDLGLEQLGVDPGNLDVDDRGALVGVPGVWVAGDAAGGQQYTHLANHHAEVVADQIVGTGTRRFGDAVVPACMFIEPPVMIVGGTWVDLADDDDVVWAEVEVDTPRQHTDEHRPGFLAVAARRSTGCIVAANGIGARFDEIVHALVIAIDGKVPVSVLRRSIQPFPTVGGVLSEAFARLADELGA